MAFEAQQIIITFGGGIQSRRRLGDVDIRECVGPSVNFDLDPQYHALNRRRPFDLVATAPNAGPIRGFAQLIRQNQTVSTLVQAGDTVYTWDGGSTFTSVGTVNENARLRGPREHNFTLDEYVIITDIEKQETVKKWDGTTFQDLAHNLGGAFRAKYCRVHRERAFFANIFSGTDLPHVLLGSQIGDAEQLSNADRPSSSLGFDVAFFLVAPDLRPINGLEGAFGTFLMSTERGRMYHLTGDSAINFNVDEFHVGSEVSGSEAIKNIGNDVLMGLPGRIETLSGTLNFGDVEANDLSLPISSLVNSVAEWRIEYDRTRQRAYCFPNNQSACYVFYKSMVSDPTGAGLSPWSKWTTQHAINFTPTTVMALINPVNRGDDVYMGDDTGNIYLIDGEGAQDGGSADIKVIRRSRLFNLPEGNVFNVKGYIHYRRLFPEVITLRVLFAGVAWKDTVITIRIPGGEGVAVYKGDFWYGDPTTFYGVTFGDKIFRQDWMAAGHASHWQIEIEFEGDREVDIQEIGLEVETDTT